MHRASSSAGLLARAAAQFTIGTDVLRFVWRHPANSGQRVRAVLRAIGYQAQVRLLGRRVMARLGERSLLWVDAHRTAASKVIYANPPDLPEMLVWRRALRDGGLFVDVGANVGSYAILAAELGAEVIAVEPAADTFGLLSENIALNGYQVRAVQAAAGSHCGTARFTSGLDAGNRLAVDGSAVTELITVDSLVGDRRVRGMKVDVEGFEIDVLHGAARALAERRIGLIQLEWNEASWPAVGTDRRPVAELLAGHGYRLYRPDADGRLVEVADPGFGADVFARPDLTARPDLKRNGQRVERRDGRRGPLAWAPRPVIQGVAVRDEDLGHGLRVLVRDLADHGGPPGKYPVAPGEHGELGSLHVDLDYVRGREPVRERVEGDRRDEAR
jgi:FkbM family methyltransferase